MARTSKKAPPVPKAPSKDSSDDEVMTDPEGETTGSRVPKKTPTKGKKDMSKYASKTVWVSSPQHNRHLVSVHQVREGIFVTHATLIHKNKHKEPFTKPFKEFIAKGLSDVQENIDSDERKFVLKCGIVMQCPRRGVDGEDMPQSTDKNFPWLQWVHKIPRGTPVDDKTFRTKILKVMVAKINELSATSKWPVTFEKGKDTTPDDHELSVVNSKVKDCDVAKLVLGMYDLPTEQLVREFMNESTQMSNFFAPVSKGKQALIEEFNNDQD